jgi:hypothetical protein
MAEKEKQLWEKPQLIVLGRSRPEERVLIDCKNLNESGPEQNPCVIESPPSLCNRQPVTT